MGAVITILVIADRLHTAVDAEPIENDGFGSWLRENNL